MYSKRAQNKTTKKSGYYPRCENFWKTGLCPKANGSKVKCKDCENRRWTRLEGTQIINHLRGIKEDSSDVIGIYPLFPDGTCRFLVFDFDNHDKGSEDHDYANSDDYWRQEVDALRKICFDNAIPALTERSRSGKGAHVWIFFDVPVSAATAPKFGFALLDKGAESVNMTSFRFYDRLLPAQDYLQDGQLGNLIALPLQGSALKNGNSAFIDANWNPYPDQWEILRQTKKLTLSKVEELLQAFTADTLEIIDGDQGDPSLDVVKPWNRGNRFHAEDVSGTLSLTLSNQIYIEAKNLKPRIQNQIRRLAAFPNPVFFKNNAIGFSNYANRRYVYLGEDDSGYICIPRGLLETLTEKCDEAGICYSITDERCAGASIHVSFTGKLRDNQEKAVSALLSHDTGILSAATAFGKTVVCSNLIAQRKFNTLIILESTALIEQWEKALTTFLVIDEALPEYRTKTGRRKIRKSLIGVIQGAKDTSTGIIDIAMAGSLYKNGEPHPRLKEYGMVLVDECHHSASETVSRVLKEVNANMYMALRPRPSVGMGWKRLMLCSWGQFGSNIRRRKSPKNKGLNI